MSLNRVRGWAVAVVCALGASNAQAQTEPTIQAGIAGVYSGASISPGTTDIGLHCDDCVMNIALPFPIRFYGKTFTSAAVCSNGNLQFGNTSTQFTAECLPTARMDTMMAPLWDDLILVDPGDGVFTSVEGAAPNRIFNIEWRAHYFSIPGAANFEIRLFENSHNFEYVYGSVAGTLHTIGAQYGQGFLGRSPRCNFSTAPAPGTRYVWTESYTGARSTQTLSQRFLPTGVTDVGNHCDDCSTQITFPFPVRFYDHLYNSAWVTSNGTLQFESDLSEYFNDCLPARYLGPAILAHWDDLRTDDPGSGIFTAVGNAAPFRTFDVEWRAKYFSTGTTARFSLRFFEGLDLIESHFGQMDEHGISATLGIQAGDDRYNESWCNTTNSANLGDVYTWSRGPMEMYSPGANAPAGTTDVGNHCDDCTTQITFPFTVKLFGREYTSAWVASNGTLQFDTDYTDFFNDCLPSSAFGTTIFGYWDDLVTDVGNSGVFTTIYGSAPNRSMGLEWRARTFAGGATINFTIVVYENQPKCDIYWRTIENGNPTATVGVQNFDSSQVLQYSCFALGRMPGRVQFLCLNPLCPADFNADNTVNSQDFFDFLGAFFNASADFNHDGATNSQDLFDFITAFFTPC